MCSGVERVEEVSHRYAVNCWKYDNEDERVKRCALKVDSASDHCREHT